MACLQRGGSCDKDPEPEIADKGAYSRNLVRTACAAAELRNGKACEQQQGGGTEDQGKHLFSRGGGKYRTACERCEDKADRAPDTDAPIIEPRRSRDSKGDGIAKRHQRGLRRQRYEIERNQDPQALGGI